MAMTGRRQHNRYYQTLGKMTICKENINSKNNLTELGHFIVKEIELYGAERGGDAYSWGYEKALENILAYVNKLKERHPKEEAK